MLNTRKVKFLPFVKNKKITCTKCNKLIIIITFFFCPSLHTLAIAWSSLAGFQSGSNITSLFAPIKFKPQPPALLLSMKIKSPPWDKIARRFVNYYRSSNILNEVTTLQRMPIYFSAASTDAINFEYKSPFSIHECLLSFVKCIHTFGSLNLSTIFCLFLIDILPSRRTYWYLQGYRMV